MARRGKISESTRTEPPIWGYVCGRTYTGTKKELTARKNALQTYTLSANSVTFSELSQNWESFISLGVKASTAAHYHYTLAHYILPVLGKMRLQTLNEMILERGLLQIITPQDAARRMPQTVSAQHGAGVPCAGAQNLPICRTSAPDASLAD